MIISSKENMIFNNINLAEEFTDPDNPTEDYLIVNNVSGRGIYGKENNSEFAAGMSGSHPLTSRIPSRILTVDITIKGKDFNHLRKKIRKLNNILHQRDIAPIIFSDEPDVVYRGRISDVDEVLEVSKIYQGSVTIECPDPFKYGLEITAELRDSPTSVKVDSPFNAQPIFNIVFTKSTDNFTINHKQSRRHLRVIYDFDKDDKLTLDATNRRVQINGIDRMHTLSHSSAWFNLISGDNSFEFNDDVADVELRYRERWL